MKKNLIKYFFIVILGISFIYIILDYNIGIPCIFHKITNLYCPGCGITRCLKSILTLNFYQAFRYNILITILLPFFIFYFIYSIVLKKDFKIPNYIWYILLFIIILFGVFRNIPYFSYLAPTII